ncbi:CHAP domain-containing protein [Alteriqipengyuania sp. 357]
MNPAPKNLFIPLTVAALSLGITGVSYAQPAAIPLANAAASGQELPPYLQCVPYAREVSGIDIYGDARSWWEKAAGRFERGHTPRVGAVMAFIPYGNMQLGHVAAVSRVIDSRTVLLDHANWSPIDGRRGQIERNVKAVDVSPDNDWSAVRVWYDPLQGLGKTAWPVHGFIYPDGTPQARPRQQFAQAKPVRPQPTREEPSKAFLSAFTDAPKARLAQASTPVASARVSRAPAQRPVARTAYATATPLTPRREHASYDGNSREDRVQRAVAMYD